MPLTMHRDARGCFTEVFREQWLAQLGSEARPVQWNVVSSTPNTLRGMHVHTAHEDYLVLIQGAGLVGLYDLREDSPTKDLSVALELTAAEHQALIIPPGVVHGFYFKANAMHLYGVSEYWNASEEIGCRFDDPALNLSWPNTSPTLSERDATLGSLATLRSQWRSAQKTRGSSTNVLV